MPRDLAIKLLDVEIEEDVHRNELRWRGLKLGLREAEIAALLAQGVTVAERHLDALDVER
ncbi:hypothetical protein KXR53_21085 [Inquilinus limosus]|uniref:hypothetical protein n=1 Tax=Inquilinus limosus TaxID=171674 RepID=UPI003F16A335